MKKDEKIIENKLKNKKEQYNIDYEKIKEKDFDIFGNVVEDNTKIKVLNNNKHREINKDEYKILDIHVDTTLESYKENIINYNEILEKSIIEMQSLDGIGMIQDLHFLCMGKIMKLNDIMCFMLLC